MISVDQATEIILDRCRDFGEEQVPLSAAVGRVLRQEIVADRDFPPFDRVSMDGIAIAHQAFAAGRRSFALAGLQAAGAPQQALLKPEETCLEVMTGAILPAGADTVIPYEQVSIAARQAQVQAATVQPGQNVHPQGFDREQGELLVHANTLITPAEVGLAATVGLAQLRVARLPAIAVFSTGDELVGVEEAPAPHQIRASNVHSIAAALAELGITADCFHLPDEEEAIRQSLGGCLKRYDALIISGGVSKGQRDYVAPVLEALGVKQLFHRVAQRPGKPFWFGQAPRGATIFALPGNPLAALVCTLRYVIPWVRQSWGLSAMMGTYAALSQDFHSKPQTAYFLPVKIGIHLAKGIILAYPSEAQGSGDLAHLAQTDGFLELPAGQGVFRAGKLLRLLRYRPPWGSLI
jgi:molybdopterin molybdotransferase